MTEQVNGLTSYVTSEDGTVTYYIPQNGLTKEEIAHLDARETEVNDSTYADIETALKNSTWDQTGRTGWQHFKGYVAEFDSDSDFAVISDDFAVADTSTGMTQAELENLIRRVNAIQNLVNG